MRLISEHLYRDALGVEHYTSILHASGVGYYVYTDGLFYTTADSFREAEDAADDFATCEGWEERRPDAPTYSELLERVIERGASEHWATSTIMRLMDDVEERTGTWPDWTDPAPGWVREIMEG